MHRLAAIVTAVATSIALIIVLMSIDFGKILPTLHQLRPTTIALVVIFLTANFVLAYFRFERTLAALGASIGWRTAVRAFLLGTLASQFLFNIIGQSLTRAMVLRSAAVPMSLTVVATYLERLIALGMLGGLATVAAVVLFGSLGFELQEGGAYFLSLGIGLSVTLGFAGVRAAASALTSTHLPNIVATTLRLLPTLVLNILMLASMFGAYFTLALEFSPSASMMKLASAIIIVMFAAAVPISWAGWGLREFGAVYALGAIGMPSEAAVIVAVTIGTISLLLMLIAGCVALIEGWLRPLPTAASEQAVANSLPAADAILFWPIGILVACLIYFQLRIPTGAEDLTLNVVDPLALTAFFFAAYRAVNDGFLKLFPPSVIGAVLALAGVLLLGALVAWIEVGLTQWALLNRLLGFVILLGYAAVGGLVVSIAGERGCRILADAFVVSALLICGIEVAAYVVHLCVAPLPLDFFGYLFKVGGQLEGYAQNPNAFAFQLLMAVCVLVAFRPPKFHRSEMPWSMLAIVALLAVVLIGRSRAGLVAGFVVVTLPALLRFAPFGFHLNRKPLVFLLVALIVLVPLGIEFRSAINQSIIGPLSALWRVDATKSDALRWETITAGTQQWLQYPIFGHGLGSFLLERQRTVTNALVIHSVPVWFLAEMGLVGLAAYAFFIVSLLNWGLTGSRQSSLRHGVVMAVTLFVLMGLVHDIFFQRTFWFGIGLMLTTAFWAGDEAIARSLPDRIPVTGDPATSPVG